MVYWCFTALPKALWQLCLWFMPVSLQYPTLGKNFEKKAKTWENQKTLKKPTETCRNQKNLQKPWKTKKKKKPWKNKKKDISGLFGGGGVPAKTLWKSFFFLGFGHYFQPFAPFCRLAVRCLHAFKLAGTNRLTTAAMNILGLRIKTVCSNFEMFGHVLDNNLSFMLYFLKNVA